MLTTTFSCLFGFWALNLGPHAIRASLLLTELSSQPHGWFYISLYSCSCMLVLSAFIIFLCPFVVITDLSEDRFFFLPVRNNCFWLGLEWWLSSCEHLLLLQRRTLLKLPGPTWWVITICHSRSRGSNIASGPFRHQACNDAHTYTEAKVSIYKIKIKNT